MTLQEHMRLWRLLSFPAHATILMPASQMVAKMLLGLQGSLCWSAVQPGMGPRRPGVGVQMGEQHSEHSSSSNGLIQVPLSHAMALTGSLEAINGRAEGNSMSCSLACFHGLRT